MVRRSTARRTDARTHERTSTLNKTDDRETKGLRDFGYVRRGRGAEVEDRRYRESHRSSLRSAYLAIVGENPDLGPNDVAGAQLQLDKINEAIRHGHWTRGEWARLHTMKKKYELRVQGRDARYRVVGNKKGGLTKQQAQEVQHYQSLIAIWDMIDEFDTEKDEA